MVSDLFVFWLVFQMVCERSEVFASACALARAFPLFTHRSSASRRTEKKTVTVEFFLVGQNNGPIEVATLKVRFWVFSVIYSFFSIIPWSIFYLGFFFSLLHAQIYVSGCIQIGVVSKVRNYPRSKFLEMDQLPADWTWIEDVTAEQAEDVIQNLDFGGGKHQTNSTKKMSPLSCLS